MTVTDGNATSQIITMICPNLNCGRTVTTSTCNRGRTARCPYCNALFRVPQQPPRPAAAQGGGADSSTGK